MKSFNDYLKEAALSAKQKKIAAVAGDKDKIDAADLAALRNGKKPVEEASCDGKYMKKEELVGKQHKLDKNHNGKLDAQDFKMLRKEETEELDEGKMKELSMDLKDLTDEEFQKKYNLTKKEARKILNSKPEKVNEDDLQEEDLILVPGHGRNSRGFISKASDRTDREVEMAKGDLYQSIKNAKMIFDMLGDVSEEDGIEGWVQEKIIKASDYLNTVREYMEQQRFANEMTGGVIAGGMANEGAKKKVNPYAIGMAQAMKSTGDRPPLKKSTIVKGHEIAKKIKQKEVDEGWKSKLAGAALAGAAALGGGGAHAQSSDFHTPLTQPSVQQTRADYIKKLPQVDSVERTGGPQATVTFDGKEYQGTILQPDDPRPRFGPGTRQARVEAAQLGFRGLGSYVVYFVNDRAYIELR